MITRKLLAVSAMTFAIILCGCSTHVVRCDGKLSRINAPTPASKASQTPPTEAKP